MRDDRDYWHELDTYLADAGARVTHGICPDCYRDVVLPELEERSSERGEAKEA